MKDKTFQQWTRELADSNHKYGAGSATSIVGAFAVSLAEYVFGFQLGKEEYADREEEIIKAKQKAEKLSVDLLELAEKDADAFAPVIPLYRLPKDTEEERAYRQKKIDQGLLQAAQPPLETLLKMDEVMDLFEQLIKLEIKGSIVEDIAVGLIFIEAVIESGKLNCDVNTKSIKDATLRTQMITKVDDNYHRIIERCHSLKGTAFNITKNNT